MIRFIKIVLILFIVQFSGEAQDVFNLENSRRFAQYLFDSGQFDLASDEFERVVFMKPDDHNSIHLLLKAYRFQDKYDIGVKRAFELMPECQNLEKDLIREILMLSFLAEKFERSKNLLSNCKQLNEKERMNYNLSIMILQRDWGQAQAYIDDQGASSYHIFNSLSSVVDRHSEIRRKSPFVAAGLSTVIPGLGKIYTNDWQDGLIAFMFVASNAWQAYRGFSKDGIKSTYGWVFGTIGTGFWLGNIYGSFKSARNYNNHQNQMYYDYADEVVFDNL